MSASLSVREQQKRDRRERISQAAMRLFRERGFHETTVTDIAQQADVSRGTFFNYFPYKEAILIEYFSAYFEGIRERVAEKNGATPVESLYFLFDELAEFVTMNKDLALPLAYELLNPDPERSSQALQSLPLIGMLRDYLTKAREQSMIRSDFSRERMSRMLANTFFFSALQWAQYRQDREIKDELRTTLKLTLEGIAL